MSIFNFWRKKATTDKIPSNNRGKVSNPHYELGGSTTSRQSARKVLYDEYLQDLESYRYNRDPDKLIDKLSRFDSDMSDAIHNFLIALDSGVKFSVTDQRGNIKSGATKRLHSCLKRMEGHSVDRSISTVLRQVSRLCLTRGACGMEVITDDEGYFSHIRVVDPKWIDWYREGDEFVAYQKGKKVSSEFLFWCFIDPDVDSVQHIPIFLSSLQPIFFRIGVLQDLEKVVDRAGWARIHGKILEDVMIRNAPASVRRNADSLRQWLESRRIEFQSMLSGLKPEDAIVHYDSAELSYLSPSSSGNIDIAPLVKILDQQISSGLKTLPSILGRSGSSDEGVEGVLYVRGVKYIQKTIMPTLASILNLCLRLEGLSGNATITFDDVDLRSPNEIENHKLMRQKRLLELACIDFITLDDACQELTGRGLPSGFQPKWFDYYRLKHLGVSIGTTDDDDSDNGGYNQQPEDQTPGEDTIDTRTEDEKEDNILKMGGLG